MIDVLLPLTRKLWNIKSQALQGYIASWVSFSIKSYLWRILKNDRCFRFTPALIFFWIWKLFYRPSDLSALAGFIPEHYHPQWETDVAGTDAALSIDGVSIPTVMT